MTELSLAEAAERLERSPAVIAKLAVVVVSDRQAAAALKAKKLPGRKIGRTWLFQPAHVAAFKRIKRRVGRPKEETC